MFEPFRSVVKLTPPCRWLNDWLYFAKSTPSVAAERILRIQPLATAIANTPAAPSLASIMIRAVSLVSQCQAPMRRAYLPFPWPHLYESPYSVASVMFSREFEEETATFIAPLLHPEWRSLAEIDQQLQDWKSDPVSSQPLLRRLIQFSRWPWPIRRLLYWLGLRFSGSIRAHRFGTFTIQADNRSFDRMLQFYTPLTCMVYFSPISGTGELLIQCAFDHRVFDGFTAALFLSELEKALNTQILEEVSRTTTEMTSSQP